MSTTEIVRSFVDYHLATVGRVWDSIGSISEEDFVTDDPYSRGSIRNLMVHIANTDKNWLTGVKNLPDSRGAFGAYTDYPDRGSALNYWNTVAEEVRAYVSSVQEAELNENPGDIPGPRWEVLLHIVNHGTDHLSTVLQKLNSLGAPTFDQDFILWLARG